MTLESMIAISVNSHRLACEVCADIARQVARAASKGTYGRIGSLEELGEKIAEEILKQSKAND